MSLKLVGITDGEVINIEAADKHAAYAQHWRDKIVRAPKDGFRIVATDASSRLYFHFAAPRSVGALTYYGPHLLKKGKSISKYGLLLLILLRHDIMRVLQVSDSREEASVQPANPSSS